MNRTTKIKITELNPHVICVLCGGYFINATTITECLHSFCRICITRYLETSNYCPVCDVMVHKTRPLDCIRSDKTLQDLVYKLIPGLYKSEMKRRREYYAKVDHPGISQPPSEDRGDEFHERIIYTEDERFSLSLELCAESIPFKMPINVHGHNGPWNMKKKDVRYLWCPAVFSIGNIKKFIRMKFDLQLKYGIDIFHTSEPLPDYYSLMDIAFIYTWTRRTPLRLYYTVFEREMSQNIPAPISGIQSNNNGKQTEEKKGKSKTPRKCRPKQTLEEARGKKRTFIGCPGDISPDIDLEKTKACMQERNKTAMARRRVKRMMGEDDSMLDEMSESEEHLAKLTLNSSGDGRKLFVTDIRKALKENSIVDDIANSKSCNVKIVENIQEQFANLERNGSFGATQDSDSHGKASSHPSPGSESVSISLFQPLNSTYDEHHKSRANSDSLYDFADVDTELVKQKESCEKQSSRCQSKKRFANNSNKESSVPAKKLRANDTNLVISNNIPDLNSSTQKKRRKVATSNDADVAGMNTQMKLMKTVGKCKMEKTVSKDNDCIKRKYIRKVKLESSKNNNKAKNNKETKSLVMKTNSNSARRNSLDVDNKSVDGKLNTDCTANDSKEWDAGCHQKDLMCAYNKIENVKGNSKQQSVNDAFPSKSIKQDRTQLNYLQQPSTPLYGQIPKLDESNQGLPHSPKTTLVDVTNKETAEEEVNICDSNGAKTNDSVCVHGGATEQEINVMKNVEYVDNCSYGDSLQPVVSVHQIQVARGLRYFDTHSSHLEMSRNNLNAFPSNSLHTISQDMHSPSHMNAREGHLLTNGSAHGHNDTICDQPLDLTSSNGHRDGYAKGKIFKTKLLKKSLLKQEIVNSHREKTTTPNSNDLKSSSQ